MSSNPAHAGRTSALIAALVVGGALLVASIIGAVPTLSAYFGGFWTGRADLMTGRSPQIPVNGEVPTEPSGADYPGVLISSSEALSGPRTLQAIAAALAIVVVIAGSLLLAIMINVMFFMGFPPVAQYVAKGLIIVAAMTLRVLRER